MGLILNKGTEVPRYDPEAITYYRLFGATFRTPTAQVTETHSHMLDALSSHLPTDPADAARVAQAVQLVNHAYEMVTQRRGPYDAATRLGRLCS